MTPPSELIRQLRERAGLTQTELALKVGKSNGAVSQWETGRALPRRDIAFRLDQILGGEGAIAASMGYKLPDDATPRSSDHEQRISQLEEEVRELQLAVKQVLERVVRDARGSMTSGRSNRAVR